MDRFWVLLITPLLWRSIGIPWNIPSSWTCLVISWNTYSPWTDLEISWNIHYRHFLDYSFAMYMSWYFLEYYVLAFPRLFLRYVQVLVFPGIFVRHGQVLTFPRIFLIMAFPGKFIHRGPVLAFPWILLMLHNWHVLAFSGIFLRHLNISSNTINFTSITQKTPRTYRRVLEGTGVGVLWSYVEENPEYPEETTWRHRESNPGRSGGKRWFYPCAIL